MPTNVDQILYALYETLLRVLYDLDIEDKQMLKKAIFGLKDLSSRSKTYVSNIQPSDVTVGDMWFDTNVNSLKIYTTSGWVLSTDTDIRTFLDLTDTPDSYQDQKNKLLTVSTNENSIVFKNVNEVFNKSFTGTFTDTNNIYIQHNLNSYFIYYKIYDSYGYEFIPDSMRVIDENTIEIKMTHETSGRYVIFAA